MNDEQLKRPLCNKCHKHPILCLFHTVWVCGDCAFKLAKKESEMKGKWIEEVNLDE